jgi:transcriptional regulator with XRE-family HTH domain
MSGDDADVADHRSERYRKRAKEAGLVIQHARSRAGWSQAQLAERAGLNKSDVSRVENGKHLEISVGRFFDLCEALSLDPVYVWTGETRRGMRHSDRAPTTPTPVVESEVRPSSGPKRK